MDGLRDRFMGAGRDDVVSKSLKLACRHVGSCHGMTAVSKLGIRVRMVIAIIYYDILGCIGL